MSLGVWFAFVNYKAELLLQNNGGFDIISWRSTEKILPNLAAEMPEKKAVPDNQVPLYKKISRPAWWNKNVQVNYALTKREANDLAANFEYELKLSVDANKRAAYLQKTNEQPSPYEKVFTVLTGSVQVANVVDQVKFTGATYQITSVGNLIAGMSTALGGQRLVRESQGTLSPTGMISNVYQEKRGNTDLLISRYEPPKKAITFFKTSLRNPTGSAPLEGSLIDLVNVGYQFIDRPLPTKPVTYQVSDARSVKRYTLVPAELWEFPLDGKKIKAQRFYKTTSKDDTATFEIWFSQGRNLPLRSMIGLSEQYGATIQVDLKKIPVF